MWIGLIEQNKSGDRLIRLVVLKLLYLIMIAVDSRLRWF